MAALDGTPDLLLVNAKVLRPAAAQPAADALIVSGGRIAWVGSRSSLSPAMMNAANVIDCGGQAVAPGFIDAHCHILAFAASLMAVDCSPNAVSSIKDIVGAVRRRVERTPRGEWIRAAGYSEFDLREGRHPTRWDLDRAAPNHPVRLNHRSGHACVLNGVALERVGITASTEEPPGGTIARDLDSAEPNGLLLEMDDWLEERMSPISGEELQEGMGRASRQFLSQGVTSVMDATPTNSPDRWNLLRRFRADSKFVPFLSVMPSAARLDEFADAGLPFRFYDGLSALGHAKIMLTRTSGRLHPSPEELRELVMAAHGRGFPVAIHAVEADAVKTAAETLAANRIPGLRDRIEHAAECPPETMDALIDALPVVVSQPRFLWDSGARYLSEFGDNARWLYRFRAAVDAGLVLAASSDAPASMPSPLLAMHAAITRRAQSGEVIGSDERLTALQALEMHTGNAAYATYRENEVGVISEGKRADLVVLSDDPTSVVAERMLDMKVMMTIANGKVVWWE